MPAVLLQLIAALSLLLGVIGIFVPGLPTTVFIIIAAWAAARSSPRLHAWLLAHPLFGPSLHNWQNGRRVGRRAKWSAAAGMTLCGLLLWLAATPTWLLLAALTCMACVLIWLCSRPEPASATSGEPPSAGE